MRTANKAKLALAALATVYAVQFAGGAQYAQNKANALNHEYETAIFKKADKNGDGLIESGELFQLYAEISVNPKYVANSMLDSRVMDQFLRQKLPDEIVSTLYGFVPNESRRKLQLDLIEKLATGHGGLTIPHIERIFVIANLEVQKDWSDNIKYLNPCYLKLSLPADLINSAMVGVECDKKTLDYIARR